jgi:hypothetical protein
VHQLVSEAFRNTWWRPNCVGICRFSFAGVRLAWSGEHSESCITGAVLWKGSSRTSGFPSAYSPTTGPFDWWRVTGDWRDATGAGVDSPVTGDRPIPSSHQSLATGPREKFAPHFAGRGESPAGIDECSAGTRSAVAARVDAAEGYRSESGTVFHFSNSARFARVTTHTSTSLGTP